MCQSGFRGWTQGDTGCEMAGNIIKALIMARRLATAAVLTLGCMHTSVVAALGLGELRLESFLNEPLTATVDILNTVSIQISVDRLANVLGVRPDPLPLLARS